MPTLQDRFRGCLIGQAIGDALGARFEAQSAEGILARFPDPEALFEISDEIWYTDDTQMAIGVAETLVACGKVSESELCQAFVANYVPSRGYGRGTRAVLEAMEDGRDYRAIAEKYFPGGSHGNGAAMRVAPVGLLFHHDPRELREQARLSALPTHLHPLGIEGAQLIALAVGIGTSHATFDKSDYWQQLSASCTTPEFRDKIELASCAMSVSDLAALGNGIQANDSVPTALASFALAPESFVQAVGQVILLGGDTDTLAAMTGALSGAHLGIDGIPQRVVQSLESSPKGREFLMSLADQLYNTHCRIKDAAET
jgi:poly(ADP-ribose) glycohydrolase ARH3